MQETVLNNCLRDSLILSHVRNSILQNKLNRLGVGFINPNTIMYGETFVKGSTFEDFDKMIMVFLCGNKRFLVFSANGEIGENSVKRVKRVNVHTYLISFVVDKEQKKLVIINPVVDDAVDEPYIVSCVRSYFSYPIEVFNYDCSVNESQAWTLYLIFKWFKKDCFITQKFKKKYNILLKFYKSLINNEIFCKEFTTIGSTNGINDPVQILIGLREI
jgi:hypothetical protein